MEESNQSKNPAKRGSLKASQIVTIAALVFVGVMFFLGERDPAVTLGDSGVSVRAMYSVTIPYAEISRVELLEKSMSEIGVGARTNGYDGFGRTLRGHFASAENGSVLLFVTPDSAPTIYIDRETGEDAYVSFKDAAKTRAVYAEIAAALPQP